MQCAGPFPETASFHGLTEFPERSSNQHCCTSYVGPFQETKMPIIYNSGMLVVKLQQHLGIAMLASYPLMLLLSSSEEVVGST